MVTFHILLFVIYDIPFLKWNCHFRCTAFSQLTPRARIFQSPSLILPTVFRNGGPGGTGQLTGREGYRVSQRILGDTAPMGRRERLKGNPRGRQRSWQYRANSSESSRRVVNQRTQTDVATVFGSANMAGSRPLSGESVKANPHLLGSISSVYLVFHLGLHFRQNSVAHDRPSTSSGGCPANSQRPADNQLGPALLRIFLGSIARYPNWERHSWLWSARSYHDPTAAAEAKSN